MTIALSTRAAAEKDPARHQFVMGVGYVRHPGPPPVRTPVAAKKDCSPPAGTADGAKHVLKRSPDGEPVTFAWHAANGSWRPVTTTHFLKGARMAFQPDYLASIGWEYVGAVEEE